MRISGLLLGLALATQAQANTGPGKPVTGGRRILVIYNGDVGYDAQIVNGSAGFMSLLTSVNVYAGTGFNFTVELINMPEAANAGQTWASATDSVASRASMAVTAQNYCLVLDLRFNNKNYNNGSGLATAAGTNFVRGDTIIQADVNTYANYLATGGGLFILGDNYYDTGVGRADGFISRMENMYRLMNAVASTGVGPNSNGFNNGPAGPVAGTNAGTNWYTLTSDFNSLAGVNFNTWYSGYVTTPGSGKPFATMAGQPTQYVGIAWNGAGGDLAGPYAAGRMVYWGDVSSLNEGWAGTAGDQPVRRYLENAIDFLYNDTCCTPPASTCPSSSAVVESPNHPVIECFQDSAGHGYTHPAGTGSWDGTQDANGSGGGSLRNTVNLCSDNHLFSRAVTSGDLSLYSQICFSFRHSAGSAITLQLWDASFGGQLTGGAVISIPAGAGWTNVCRPLIGSFATTSVVNFRVMTALCSGAVDFFLDDVTLIHSCGTAPEVHDPACCSPTSPTRTPTRTRTRTPTVTYTPTIQITPTYTLTLTLTRTPTPTATRTVTPTVSFTPTHTRTLTATPTSTLTLTRTPTPSVSFTPTPTLTATPSVTFTASPTRTLTRTLTLTSTITVTPTRTATTLDTPTNTRTLTGTSTQTLTSTPSSTLTRTPTSTPTYTVSFTPSSTPTRTHTRTVTPSFTDSSTITPGPSPTFTVTSSQTRTSTPTRTSSPSMTATPSGSPTSTISFTRTYTSTRTDTPTVTPTFTDSSTITPGPSPTFTSTFTATRTHTPTATESMTRTHTRTVTPSFTDSSTITPGPSPTFTSTLSNTPTHTPTFTESMTRTHSPTQTSTRTHTPTFTATPTFSETNLNTRTNTPTNTPTSTATPSLTATRTSTASATQTATFTATHTRTATATYTATSTRSVTWTHTPTRTASSTFTPSSTASSTPSATPSITITLTATLSPSFSPTPVPMPYHLTVRLFNSAGEQVKLLFDGRAQVLPNELSVDASLFATGNGLGSALQLPGRFDGTGSLIWLGENDNGQLVSGGVYYFKAEYKDPFGVVSTLIEPVQVLDGAPEQRVAIYNSAGELVRELLLPAGSVATDLALQAQDNGGVRMGLKRVQGGDLWMDWDGYTSQGSPAASGAYTAVLISKNGLGQQTVVSRSFQFLKSPGNDPWAGLAVGPNPARPADRELKILAPALAGLPVAELYNLAGELIVRGRGTVFIGNLSSGIYVLRIRPEGPAQAVPFKCLKFVILK